MKSEVSKTLSIYIYIMGKKLVKREIEGWQTLAQASYILATVLGMTIFSLGVLNMLGEISFTVPLVEIAIEQNFAIRQSTFQTLVGITFGSITAAISFEALQLHLVDESQQVDLPSSP